MMVPNDKPIERIFNSKKKLKNKFSSKAMILNNPLILKINSNKMSNNNFDFWIQIFPKNLIPFHEFFKVFKHKCEHLNDPHITIHNGQFFVGKQSQRPISNVHDILKNNAAEFCNNVANAFKNTLGTTCFLDSPKLKIMGQGETKFLVVAYDVQKNEQTFEPVITTFRKEFYQIVFKTLKTDSNKIFKFDKTRTDNKIGYQLYDNNSPFEKGETVMVIPNYNFGIGVWQPHMTLCSLNDLKVQLPDLYSSLIKETVVGFELYDVNLRNFFDDNLVPEFIFFDENTLQIKLGNDNFVY